jgi:hypothetical protein
LEELEAVSEAGSELVVTTVVSLAVLHIVLQVVEVIVSAFVPVNNDLLDVETQNRHQNYLEFY